MAVIEMHLSGEKISLKLWGFCQKSLIELTGVSEMIENEKSVLDEKKKKILREHQEYYYDNYYIRRKTTRKERIYP